MTGSRIVGRVAVVTGAARGIGRACALRLAEEGADIAAVDIGAAMPTVPYEPSSTRQLEDTAKAVRALGRRCLPLVADVRDGEAMRAAVASTVRELGSVDILVAAAGIDSWGSAWELTDDQWDAMLAVNLKGVWQSAKAVSPEMISQRSSAMVFLGSVLSHRANRQFAHYTAAKHGVLGLVRAFGLELAEYNVRVNSVDPTVVFTDMVTSQQYMDNLIGHAGATEEEVRNHYLQWNVLPTPWIEPRDVANAALFLASDEARFITGVGLPLDAGAMLR
jgi:SDR family mycofactocin-dependent oxidoreductase